MSVRTGSRAISIRLAIGAALDVFLLLMLPSMARWSSEEREVGAALIYAGIGAAAMLCVGPVLRRGTDIQRVAAVIVLVISVFAFWPAADCWLL